MMKGPFVDIVAGARPNFMKAGPIYQELAKEGSKLRARFVYSGQHTGTVMSSDIYRWVGLPSHPDVILGSNKNPGFDYLGDMMSAYDSELRLGPYKPLACIVLGDTDTALAAAIASSRNKIPVFHVEAGVRSHDIYAPEELNRTMIDSISDMLFTPFDEATWYIRDKVRGRTTTVGNVMVDALRMVQSNEEFNEVIDQEEFDILVTIHRQNNVDAKDRLREIMAGFDELNKRHRLLFPAHPRTRSQLRQLHVHRPWMVDPLPYAQFLKALMSSKAVITDSGGVQAEAAAVGIPCFVLRETSGWENLIKLGLVTLITLDNMYEIVDEAIRSEVVREDIHIPGWDGNSAKRIAHDIKNYIQRVPSFVNI